LTRRAPKSVPDVLAAVDLGSNSFHMVVARYTHGQLVILDRLREMVRLGAGLESDGRLNKEVGARALACLERFGQRLRDMRPDSVRVAGTNVFRRAKRAQAFIERAREAIGHPIEIVSGIEEARLIYSGVAHTMPAGPGRRLVCDIGGGSTEIIIGEGLQPLELESLQIGCVRLSEEFFAEGRLSQKRMQRCRVAARQAIDASGTNVLLTARSEGFIVGRPDLDETIRRLTAFADAGAECLYAPGLRAMSDIKAVVGAVAPKPVNVLVGSDFSTVAELAEAGVRRISVGGALARAAWAGFMAAAKEIAERGTFTSFSRAVPFAEINGSFGSS
jgi:hypothetical protein